MTTSVQVKRYKTEPTKQTKKQKALLKKHRGLQEKTILTLNLNIFLVFLSIKVLSVYKAKTFEEEKNPSNVLTRKFPSLGPFSS